MTLHYFGSTVVSFTEFLYKMYAAFVWSHVLWHLSRSIFHLLLQPRGDVLSSFATPNRLHPHTRVAGEAAAALNSRHFMSAPAVHSGSSLNKSDTLCAKVFFTAFSARSSYFIRQNLVCHLQNANSSSPTVQVQHLAVATGAFTQKLQPTRSYTNRCPLSSMFTATVYRHHSFLTLDVPPTCNNKSATTVSIRLKWTPHGPLHTGEWYCCFTIFYNSCH